MDMRPLGVVDREDREERRLLDFLLLYHRLGALVEDLRCMSSLMRLLKESAAGIISVQARTAFLNICLIIEVRMRRSIRLCLLVAAVVCCRPCIEFGGFPEEKTISRLD